MDYRRHIPHRDASGGSVDLVEIEDGENRAARIAQYIASISLPPSDILILTRSRMELSNHLMQELCGLGVRTAPPDRIPLSENLLVMDIIALAEICSKSHNNYKLACILKSPYIFETPLTNDELLELQGGNLLASIEKAYPDKWSVIASAMQLYDPDDLVGFFYWITMKLVRKLHPEDGHIISSFMDEVLKASQKGSDNIQEFLEGFKGVYISSQNIGDGGVRLSTIHGAKGLESPVVCLLDFDLTPDKSRTKFVWTRKMCFFVKPSLAESTHGINEILEEGYALESDELMRLLYVAMTRAQDRLIVFGTSRRQGAYKLLKDRLRLPANSSAP